MNNCKTRVEEVEKDINKQSYQLIFHDLKDKMIKVSILLKVIYRVNAMPTEAPTVSAEIEKHNLEFIWNLKETSISKTILKKKSKKWKTHTHDFKTY